MSPKTSALPAVGLAALLVLAGCAGFTGQLDDGQQQQVADRLADRLQDLDSFEATVTTEVETEDRSVVSKTDLAVDLSTGEYRMEILAPNRSAGDLTVYNGSAMVSYDRSENTYRTFDVEMDGPAMGSNVSAQFDQLVEQTDIIYNGTATVNGQETHKATLVPTNESSEFVDSVTLWVETDRMVPVKMEMESSAMADLTTTVTFSDVELNPEFEDGAFEFDAPEGASHEGSPTAEVETERYDSHGALASAVEFRVPPAELAEGFSFESANLVIRGDGTAASTTAMMTYTDGSTEVRVHATGLGEATAVGYDDGETVQVDGRSADYREFGDTGNVIWTCEDTQYLVNGQLEQSTLVSVADSVGC